LGLKSRQQESEEKTHKPIFCTLMQRPGQLHTGSSKKMSGQSFSLFSQRPIHEQMPFLTTPIDGLLIFEPQVWEDDRGYFFESYNQRLFAEVGIDQAFVQDNEARSTRGVLRGLHYQRGEYAQAKLVRVTQGAVYDVAVDLRKGSATYGQGFGLELSAENKLQLFIPRGFAHGYLVLTDTAVFNYKCDNLYHREAEGGIRYDDPALAIEWPAIEGGYLLSPKDEQWPAFGDHRR
jgi:dTDP-4-dehydrorhamnose 3,5-epimerase